MDTRHVNTSVTYVNIGEVHENDGYYRYKMPSIEIAIEGKGNGIKTRIVNIEDISYALQRPSRIIMKFYSLYLGTCVQDKGILRGFHTKDELTNTLNAFINTYVLCKTCTNPETTLKLKNDILRASCKACGQKHDIIDKKTIDSISKMYRKK